MINRLLNLSKAVLKRAPGIARLIRQRDDAIATLERCRCEHVKVLACLLDQASRSRHERDADLVKERDYAIAELEKYIKDDELRDPYRPNFTQFS